MRPIKRSRAGGLAAIVPPCLKGLLPSATSHDQVQDLEKRARRYWYLNLAVSLIVTAGLSSAIVSLLSLRPHSVWPWARTDHVLVAGLSLTVVLFMIYMTRQQLRILCLQRRLKETEGQISRQVRQHYEYLLGIHTLSGALASGTDSQVVFDRLVGVCHLVFESDSVALLLLDPSKQELEVGAAIGDARGPLALGSRVRVGLGVAGWVAEHREALLLGPGIDPGQLRDVNGLYNSGEAVMAVPIILRDELIGVLVVRSEGGGASYVQEDLQALHVFAEHTGSCILHMERIDWIRAANRQICRERKPSDSTGESLAA
jgi:hypothetical protein